MAERLFARGGVEGGAPAPRPPASHWALRTLLGLWLVLATHGSLYPWRLEWPASAPAQWIAQMYAGGWWSSTGDVIGNVVLFVPLGVLGHAWLRGTRAARRWRTAALLLAGTAFALALQVAQLFVPARSAALSDVFWNAMGLALGLILAQLSAPRLARLAGGAHARAALPLAVLWLALEWWPFVPTLDWQHVKDALKPLLLQPQWKTATAVEAALSVALVGLTLQPLHRRAVLLGALVAAAVLAKPFLAGQLLSLSRCSGWLLGALLAAAAWRVPSRAAALGGALLALAWFTFDELRPFAFGAGDGPFHALPLAALLRGSMLTNALALSWLLFWIGAVMLLLVQALGVRAAPAAALALSLWALALELVQTTLPGRVADITPALLPWFWWLALPLVHAPAAAHPAPGTAAAVAARSRVVG